MKRELQKLLSPFRQRLQRRQIMIRLLQGAFWGGVLGFVVGVMALLSGSQLLGLAALGILVVVPVGSVVSCFIRGISWEAAANAADRQGKHDAATTALWLVEQPASDDWASHQVSLALTQLQSASPAAAIPFGLVGSAWLKAGLLNLATCGVVALVWLLPAMPGTHSAALSGGQTSSGEVSLLPVRELQAEPSQTSGSLADGRQLEAAPHGRTAESAGLQRQWQLWQGRKSFLLRDSAAPATP